MNVNNNLSTAISSANTIIGVAKGAVHSGVNAVSKMTEPFKNNAMHQVSENAGTQGEKKSLLSNISKAFNLSGNDKISKEGKGKLFTSSILSKFSNIKSAFKNIKTSYPDAPSRELNQESIPVSKGHAESPQKKETVDESKNEHIDDTQYEQESESENNFDDFLGALNSNQKPQNANEKSKLIDQLDKQTSGLLQGLDEKPKTTEEEIFDILDKMESGEKTDKMKTLQKEGRKLGEDVSHLLDQIDAAEKEKKDKAFEELVKNQPDPKIRDLAAELAEPTQLKKPSDEEWLKDLFK